MTTFAVINFMFIFFLEMPANPGVVRVIGVTYSKRANETYRYISVSRRKNSSISVRVCSAFQSDFFLSSSMMSVYLKKRIDRRRLHQWILCRFSLQVAAIFCREPFFYCRKCVFRFLALFIWLKIAAPLTIVKYNCYFECEWRKHILRPDNVLLLHSACKSQYLDFAEEQQETNRQRKNIKIDKKFSQWFQFTSLLAILFAQNLRHSKRFSFRLYYSYLLRTE